MNMKWNLLSRCSLHLIAMMALLNPQATLASDSERFWWGLSTSPYQTEEAAVPGSPDFFETDWEPFFREKKIPELKGEGTRSYSRVDRDIEALKTLGITHYRFGIEWARVEPTPGHYSTEAVAHYVHLVEQLKKAGITPIVCLWHFTFPSWVTDLQNPEKNGWFHPLAKERWAPYVQKVVEAMGPQVLLYAPQNEPNARALAAHFLGIFPPGVKYDLGLYKRDVDKAAEFYVEAAHIIKSLRPEAKIISIQNVVLWTQAWWDVFGYFFSLGQDYNFRHLNLVQADTDIIGFNYYYELKASPFPNERVTNPEGLRILARQLSDRFHKPLVITENGVPDDGDEIRQAYLRGHLKVVQELPKEGVDLRGYFYWSLIDNYEWASGYKEKFGLFTFDPKSFDLAPKESARIYVEAIKGVKRP